MKKIEVIDGRTRVATFNNEPSLAQQQFKEQCDVNNIVAKYKKTGEWLHLTRSKGVYADVSEITDYMECVQKVMNADAAFAALPSHLRNRFENDPAKLLAFLQDPNNYDEGVSLGLYEKKSSTPQPDPIKNDPTNQKTGKAKETLKTKSSTSTSTTETEE